MRRFVPVVGVALLLGVYLLTMAPTLSWSHHGADGGDLVTAVARGSIPHPPGFPTYLVLGELFIRLPLNDPAWRLNLLSAVAAVGTVGLTVVALQRLRRSSSSTLGALCAGLCLGLAPLFWSQALIAEVYTVAALFSALMILLVLEAVPGWMVGLAWGVGLGAHPVLVFLAPVVGWGVWREEVAESDSVRGEARDRSSSRGETPHGPTLLGLTSPWKGEGWGGAVWRLLAAGMATVVGLGVMLGPVLLARGGAPSPWADVGTLDGWWRLVGGRLYRGYVFALPAAAWPRRLVAWVGLLARQFTPLGALLAVVGWATLWRESPSRPNPPTPLRACAVGLALSPGARGRGLAASTLVSFGAFSLYAVGYDTADSLVYLVPALPLAAVWLGVGVDEAGGWLAERLQAAGWRNAGRLGAAAFLLLPVVQGVVFWQGMDVSGDWTAMAWAEGVLEEAPADAVLLTGRDAHTFTLWYAQEVLGQRPDVVVVDADLWAHPPYREMMAEELRVEVEGLSPEEAARRVGRPLVEPELDGA